jgi:hypothetical protein|uniref:RING-type domain-containing protein n=1 Tax=viral metagenome TaxID=1070528 RepID=A0A6C0BQP2_9ZZZZ
MNFNDHYRFVNSTELSSNDPYYTSPINCDIVFKPHQLVLINKCLEREQNDIQFDDKEVVLKSKYSFMKCDIGVIADKVGSGKTYVILGIITTDTIPNQNITRNVSYGNGHLSLNSKLPNLIDKNVNIIVIPHILQKQWCQYIELFSKKIRYYVVNKKKSIVNLESEIDNYNIILVTGTFYKYVRGIFYLNNWRARRVFYDEIDSTNTPCAHYLSTRFIWFVTASYKNILFPIQKVYYDRRNINNSYMLSHGISNNMFAKKLFTDMIKVMGQLELQAMDKIVLKNTDDFIDKSFNIPDLIQNVIGCKSPVEIDILTGLVSRDIIKCLNAGDIQTAIGFIQSGNLDTEANIINRVLEELQTKHRNISIRENAVRQYIYTSDEQKNVAIDRVVEERNDCDKKIELMKIRINENKLCIICYNNAINKCISKCCKNTYCLECISNWLSIGTTCPLCKTIVNIRNDFYIVDESNLVGSIEMDKMKKKNEYASKLPGNDEYTKSKNKFENLKRIIYNNRGKNKKFLIFSDFEQSFGRMIPYLDTCGLKYATIKGNSVNETIRKYRSDELDALLVNSRNYGSGLNLENTTDVILFHKFENQLEQQIIGRAQRPGRTSVLNVWYLLNENEMV